MSLRPALYLALLVSSLAGAQHPALGLLGERQGLVVHLGFQDESLLVAMAKRPGCLAHGLSQDDATVVRVRPALRAKATCERWQEATLPLAEQTVNVLVVEDAGAVTAAELQRVLAPGGLLCRRQNGTWTSETKPWPKDIDDWQHALHGPGNNAVANDQQVGPPERLRWVAGPIHARHHEKLASVSVVVSAGGRLFYVIDQAPAASILLAPKWALQARDAFSGVALWNRPIGKWGNHLQGFRSGPPELARRLIATPKTVYAMLALDGDVLALDAETGKTSRTFAGTKGTQEMLLDGTVLYLVIHPLGDPRKGKGTLHERIVRAVDVTSGKTLWERQGVNPLPISLAVSDGKVFYLAPDGMVGLDAKTGRELWRTLRGVTKKRPGYSSPTVVVKDGVVLCADRRPGALSVMDVSTGKKVAAWLAKGGPVAILVAYDASNGKELWRCPCAETYHAPVDVFVANGMVWIGRSLARTGPDFTEARDLRSGKVVRQFKRAGQAFKTTMPHHRCHRNRATERYLVTGRTGIEFIDTTTGEATRHHWTRGTCQFGVLPCNGLLYAPPHSCACYITAKMDGFLAYSPKSELPEDPPGSALVQNASAVAIPPARPATGSEWPSFRGNAARSGVTSDTVSPKLHKLWDVRVGSGCTSPVVAEGLVIVASALPRAIHAFDAITGRGRWQIATAGMVDSPPTISEGRVVFGSRNGYITCLRAQDGAQAWRYRVAPRDRRLVAYGELESVWPIHGSVLVHQGSVFAVAGRSSFIDGGLRLVRLDLRTGELQAARVVNDRLRKADAQPEEPRMFEMKGALPDVLSLQHGLVYMRHRAFDSLSLAERHPRDHLYSPGGFLTHDWWHRNYWIYGRHMYSGYIGWYFAGREAPAGRTLLASKDKVFGFGYKPRFYKGSTGREYHMYATAKPQGQAQPKADYVRANRDYPHSGQGKFKIQFDWSTNVPVLAQTMVLAGDTIFAAGMRRKALRSHAAFAGKGGGVICAVSARDGKLIGEFGLDGLPVDEGLAVANQRLYLAMADGRLVSLGGADQGRNTVPLPPANVIAGLPKVVIQRESGKIGHWHFDEGGGETARDSSGNGLDISVEGAWAKGEFGTALICAGRPKAATIPDGNAVRFGKGDFSLAVWVKADRWDRRLLGKENFPKNWWVINILSSGHAQLVMGQGKAAGQSVRAATKTPLSNTAWTHIAFVVQRAKGWATWYVNGKEDSKTAIPKVLTAAMDVVGSNLNIPSAHKPFSGLVDDLRIYRAALADDRVRKIYESEKTTHTSVAFEVAE